MGFLTLASLMLGISISILGVVILVVTNPQPRVMGGNVVLGPIYDPSTVNIPPITGAESFAWNRLLLGVLFLWIAWGAWWLTGYWSAGFPRFLSGAAALVLLFLAYLYPWLACANRFYFHHPDGTARAQGPTVTLGYLVFALAVAGFFYGRSLDNANDPRVKPATPAAATEATGEGAEIDDDEQVKRASEDEATPEVTTLPFQWKYYVVGAVTLLILSIWTTISTKRERDDDWSPPKDFHVIDDDFDDDSGEYAHDDSESHLEEAFPPDPWAARGQPQECPIGHGPLRDWRGKPRCWTCGWPEEADASSANPTDGRCGRIEPASVADQPPADYCDPGDDPDWVPERESTCPVCRNAFSGRRRSRCPCCCEFVHRACLSKETVPGGRLCNKCSRERTDPGVSTEPVADESHVEATSPPTASRELLPTDELAKLQGEIELEDLRDAIAQLDNTKWVHRRDAIDVLIDALPDDLARQALQRQLNREKGYQLITQITDGLLDSGIFDFEHPGSQDGDPSNAGRQHGLSASHERRGDAPRVACDQPQECPMGHGPLRDWGGKPRCWTCGWQEEVEASPTLATESQVQSSGNSTEPPKPTMFHLTFVRGQPREVTCRSVKELHGTVRKRYPNAVYTGLGSNFTEEEPPEWRPVILVWRNVREQEGRYGTGNWSSKAVGWVFRDDATYSDKQALWDRFEEDEVELNNIRINEDMDRWRRRY